jgi:putative peptidoglycan lipid II flippase
MAFALGVAETRLADSYNVANNTPNIVYELILGGILTSVFVPVFVEWLEGRSREEAWEVAHSVLSIAVTVLGAVALICVLVAPWIVRLYTLNVPHTPGGDAQRALATFLLRWFMPQILFYGIGAVATGLLNAHRRFAVPMFAPVLNNLVVIGTFLAFAALPGPSSPTPDGITTAQRYVLAVGTTLGVVAMSVALLPSLARVGYRFRWRFGWRHPAVRRIAGLALWTFVYVLVNQLLLLQVIVLAAGEKGYTAYVSAFTFFQLPHAIFAVSIMTALLPALASRWTDRDRNGFRDLLGRGIRSTAFIVLPAALGYVVLATPIVRLLLQHGAATAQDARLVADVLVVFSAGLFSFSAFQLLLRAFYAMQDTRTPALVNVGATAINVGVNFPLFAALGVQGLALGFAISYTFAAAVSAAIMRRRLDGLEGRRVMAGLSKALVAGGATAGAAWLSARLIGDAVGTSGLGGQSVQVLGSVAIGLLVFLAAALVLRMEELELLKGFLVGRLRRSGGVR